MVCPYVEEEAVVGFDDEATQLVDRLTGTKKRLEVIAIVGMAGLGKTTLSRKVYNDPLITYHFYVRAWTYVSQVYERRDTLLRLSSSITPLTLTREISEMSVERLSETLRKSLMGQRYLIVIDDIWDNGAWDDLKRSFPDNNNGSRILLTSRLKDVPFYAEPGSPPHCLNFLTEDASWALLQQKVFGKEGCCPMKLMETGKMITAKCQGLPLAIVVVAGVLASAKTLDWWSQVAEDMHSHIARDQGKYMKTLSLSYKHLPNHHMRACFLYLGAFPEDRKIPVQRLIWMWIAEGFIPHVGTKSLEDTASDYLEELINRSLVIVDEKGSLGEVKACRIHDLLRDLCLTIAKQEKFVHQMYWYYIDYSCTHCFPFFLHDHPFLVIHPRDCHHTASLPSAPNVSLVYGYSQILIAVGRLFTCQRFNFNAIRVLDLSFFLFKSFPHEIVELVDLRYLSLKASNVSPPATISNLHHLESLILYPVYEFVLPQNIWRIATLRRVVCIRPVEIFIEFPCFVRWTKDGQPHPFVLQNLHTLSYLFYSVSCQMVLQNCPNLRKLGLVGDFSSVYEHFTFPDLGFLNHLETLKLRTLAHCWHVAKSWNQVNVPETLKRLTFEYTFLNWTVMDMIGMLPNLEILKLKSNACKGQHWETSDGGFRRLKFLKFEDLNIAQWDATSNHFPSLQHLVLHACVFLKEIPPGLGDISTLEIIEISRCNDTVGCSAREIRRVQEGNGNNWPDIFIKHPYNREEYWPYTDKFF